MTDPSSYPGATSPSLRRLVDETSDLIDSPIFSSVLTLLLDAAFSLLLDTKIATQGYKLPRPSADQSRVQEIVGMDAKTKLANTLAVFCRQAHAIGSSSENEYLAAMENVGDLEAFAAVVYSSNFEIESPDFLTSHQPGPASSTIGPCSGAATVATSAMATPAGPGVGKAVDVQDPFPAGLDGEASLMEGSAFETVWAKSVKSDDSKEALSTVRAA
jgi:peroxin-3